MNITKRQLKHIIQEELAGVMREARADEYGNVGYEDADIFSPGDYTGAGTNTDPKQAAMAPTKPAKPTPQLQRHGRDHGGAARKKAYSPAYGPDSAVAALAPAIAGPSIALANPKGDIGRAFMGGLLPGGETPGDRAAMQLAMGKKNWSPEQKHAFVNIQRLGAGGGDQEAIIAALKAGTYRQDYMNK
tara:strand:- start:523 stop:1086 length:564 start_codon:yes stop_codon:yes gene_type:complete